MKKIILGLLALSSLTFASQKEILYGDVEWVYHQGNKTCINATKEGFGLVVVKMVNREGYALRSTDEKYNLKEFTDGKLNYWLFPDKESCERFKTDYN